MLHIRDDFPAGLLNKSTHELADMLPGPTLFHLPGRRSPELFVSVLLHGNETTGWDAVRHVLQRYGFADDCGVLPRAMALFIGNVAAAKEGIRHLPGQVDYNRIWPGTPHDDAPEAAMMQNIVDRMHDRGVFASIDIHNNTGRNPHYACINVLETPFFHLATLFSRTVIYFLRPRGVQSMAMSKIGPSVTLECGQPDQPSSTEHAICFIEACLNLSALPEHPIAKSDIDLFHTQAIMRVNGDNQVGFDSEKDDVVLRPNVDLLNFNELPAGTLIAKQSKGQNVALKVVSEDGEDVLDEFLVLQGDEIQLKKTVMPAMFTLNVDILRDDCICYLMERYPLPA